VCKHFPADIDGRRFNLIPGFENATDVISHLVLNQIPRVTEAEIHGNPVLV
jgi:hypothetical protein